MDAKSQSKVFKALESTESLLASLLDRSSFTPTEGYPSEDTDGGSSSSIDVEQSLLGVGENVIASYNRHGLHTQALPDPRDTLTSIVCRSVRSSSINTLSLEEQLQQKENELEITAKLGLALLERKEFLEKEVTRLTDQSRALEQRLSQARHELGLKESLLQLYYTHEEQNEEEREEGVGGRAEQSAPEWVRSLEEECSQLKEENSKLWQEKMEIEQETQKKLQMSQTLVKQCVEQLSEAKQDSLDMQLQTDQQTAEVITLKDKLHQATEGRTRLTTTHKQLEIEMEEMKEKLSESLLMTTQLSNEVAEWTDKYETCYIMLQDAKEETKMLRELTDIQNEGKSGGHTPSSEAEHGSIVSEIEAVLRQEILAASTLDERPPSPSTYARQRTMVVMETVKAATLATAKKLEKLAEDQRKKEGDLLHPVLVDPNDPAHSNDSAHRPKYVSPQKLQIVKPMEGSATLLQWKLLATPQLGGTMSFFSKSERPGIHQRNLDSPPATPTPRSVGRYLTVDNNDFQHNKRWSSTSDLSRHRINSPASSRRIAPPPVSMATEKDLSTVGKVRQNFWGLFTSPGKNKSKAPQSGLGELLS